MYNLLVVNAEHIILFCFERYLDCLNFSPRCPDHSLMAKISFKQVMFNQYPNALRQSCHIILALAIVGGYIDVKGDLSPLI